MEYFVTIEDALSKIEYLHSLTESKSKNGGCKRIIALNELARKIRVSLNALHYIPYEEYAALCAPANLLYRSMITDLMTSLLISQVDDKQLEDIIYIFDRDFTNSLKSALETNIEIRKETYPEDVEAFDEQGTRYRGVLQGREHLVYAEGNGNFVRLRQKCHYKTFGKHFCLGRATGRCSMCKICTYCIRWQKLSDAVL